MWRRFRPSSRMPSHSSTPGELGACRDRGARLTSIDDAAEFAERHNQHN